MIVFSSDPAFAEIYKAILDSDRKVDLLVSESAKNSGRGRAIKPNPAVAFALLKKIRHITPNEISPEAIREIQNTVSKSQDKLGLVFAYGKIIPQELIDVFKRQIFNLHPSLLPKYRGATPIQSALLDGAKETGFSIIKLNARLDAGDIIYQEKIHIDTKDNYQSMKEKIVKKFCKVLPGELKKIENDTVKFTKQDEAEATYTTKFIKSDGEIKKSDTPETAFLKIRAFSEWPKAYMIIAEARVIIHRAHIENGKLVIDEIQKESGKKMTFAEFKHGNQTLLTQMPDFVRI